MIKVFCLICTYMMLASNALAEDAFSGSVADIHKMLSMPLEENQGEEDLSVGGILNYQGSSPPEVQYGEGGISSAANDLAHSHGYLSLVTNSMAKIDDEDLSLNDAFLNKSRLIQKNPEKYVDWITGGYPDCEGDEENEIVNKTTKTCDEYHQITDKQCLIGRNIQVEARHKYECHKERLVEKKSCFKKLTVRCEQGTDCDSKGIIMTSVESDMKWEYNYPFLTIGTIADNYWRAWCGKFVRSTKFIVKNKELIDELKIVEVGFDDYMRISINGTQVYNGPFGGTTLRTADDVVTNGSGNWYKCELNTSWQYNVDINLLPHIREGENEIITEVVVAGAGEGWMKIKTKQHCCVPKDTWEEVCPE